MKTISERGGEEEEGLPNNKVEVIIEKNRSGARGTVELIFQKEYNKVFKYFEERNKDDRCIYRCS